MTRSFAKTATITVSAVVAVVITVSLVVPKSRAIAPYFLPGIILPVLAGAWLVEHFQKEEVQIKRTFMVRRLERCLNSKEVTK